MKNGEHETLEDRLSKRIWIINNLDKIVAESVYYRNNSEFLDESSKIVILNIKDFDSVVKVI